MPAVKTPRHPGETLETRYARHTRNAAVLLAVIVSVSALAGVIIGIVALVAAHDASAAQSGICASLGGTDPTC